MSNIYESPKTEVHAILILPNWEWPVVTNPSLEHLDGRESNRQRQHGHMDWRYHQTQNSIPNRYTEKTKFEIA